MIPMVRLAGALLALAACGGVEQPGPRAPFSIGTAFIDQAAGVCNAANAMERDMTGAEFGNTCEAVDLPAPFGTPVLGCIVADFGDDAYREVHLEAYSITDDRCGLGCGGDVGRLPATLGVWGASDLGGADPVTYGSLTVAEGTQTDGDFIAAESRPFVFACATAPGSDPLQNLDIDVIWVE